MAQVLQFGHKIVSDVCMIRNSHSFPKLLALCLNNPMELHNRLPCQSIFFLLLLSISSSKATSSSSDRITLLTFKSVISDPLDTLSSWVDNTTLHFCQWRGVTCGSPYLDRVTGLNLESLGLSATSLPPHIANLTFLQRLHLPNNSFRGSIPHELGLQLSWLTYLNISFNYLDGAVPESLTRCTNLKFISLQNNKISGEIPRDVGSLSKLLLLDLSNNNLSGTIPLSMGNISTLIGLRLNENNLIGSIPHELGQLSLLTQLNLSINYLDGKIPVSLTRCANLKILELRKNRLSGEIPKNIDSLKRLVALTLGYNQLTGTIPQSFGNMSSLYYLYLQVNGLVGSIPDSLGKLSSLRHLQLRGNQLSGDIPSSFYNLSSLKFLVLSQNHFTGTLPPNLFNSLPNLETLNLHHNRMEGRIPSSLPNATGLQSLGMSINWFSGTIPSNLGNLQYLSVFTLFGNLLEAKDASDWDFFASLTNCSYLEILVIDHNQLSGIFPHSVANLSSTLIALEMHQNQFAGSIPEGIDNLNHLNYLDLSDNFLTGSIPSTIGKLEQLHELGLSGNDFTGEIPYTIGNLARLDRLRLDRNSLSGSIPVSIGKCQGLLELDLSQNKLTGAIPKELLMLSSLSIYLKLSHNELTGLLPSEVGGLIHLAELNISDNKLSGEIPKTLGDCRSLEYLYMQSNLFDGAIPQSLRKLKGLRELDLSQNNLSGVFPDYIGRLVGLQFINLSYNHLEGDVPYDGIFINATVASVLGNKNLCGGGPNLHLPACQTQYPKKQYKSVVMTLTVQVLEVCFCLILFLVIYFVARRLKNQFNKSPFTSLPEGQFRQVSYAELLKATDVFSPANLIGVGSVGSVYKGVLNLDESTYVAVKVLNLQQRGASKSFRSECDIQGSIRHRNIVKILTSCSSIDFSGNEFKALVLEFIPRGSLDNWLHPVVASKEHSELRPLTLHERLNIAIDVASALEYLHCYGQVPIVHCDLKPSNVLLDTNMCAHVGDFGLARFICEKLPELDVNPIPSTGIKGTIGYVPPDKCIAEYGIGSQPSIYGDVYGYGILLLEMFTGKRPTNEMFKNGLSLHKYVQMSSLEKLSDIVDPRLRLLQNDQETLYHNQNQNDVCRAEESKCLVSVIGIGLSCSKQDPSERMKMKDVTMELRNLRNVLLGSTYKKDLHQPTSCATDIYFSRHMKKDQISSAVEVSAS